MVNFVNYNLVIYGACVCDTTCVLDFMDILVTKKLKAKSFK